MFEHSIKVPRSYKLAAKIVQQVKEDGGNLKTLLYQNKNKHFPVKIVHALVAETLKHDSQLNELLKKTGLLVNESRFDPWLARILITELLWGKKTLSSDCKPIQTIYKYHNEFLSLLDSLESTICEIVAEKELYKPRYIRINTLRLTAADAVRYFQDEGWNLVRCTAGSYDDFLKQVENLGPYDFLPDYHVKVVFVFAPNTPFYDCQLYQDNEIFLQDKATTLAGYLLAPTPGSTILDMCAAPGMKTTHLAAILKNEGTIYSVEQDEERYNMLCEFVEKSGATCVKPINKDVATVTKVDCPNVDYVLLDPSCSGSGIRRIQMNDATYDLESGRVKMLSNFQAKLLRHALNEFSDAKRIVYSTCSLYPEENEAVIQDVIDNHKGNFRLVSAKGKLTNWNNTGDPKYFNIGEKCIYARPESDHTSGFFVAIFEKLNDEEILNEKKYLKSNAHLRSDNNDNIRKGKQKRKSLPTNGEEMNNGNAVDPYSIDAECDSSKKTKKKKVRHYSDEINHNEALDNNPVSSSVDGKSLYLESEQNCTLKKRKKKKNHSADEIIDTKNSNTECDDDVKKSKDNEGNISNVIDKKKKKKKLESEHSVAVDFEEEKSKLNVDCDNANKINKRKPKHNHSQEIDYVLENNISKNSKKKSKRIMEESQSNEVIKKSKKMCFTDKNSLKFSDFTDVNHKENIMECEMKKADKSEKKKRKQSLSVSETIETSKNISVDESSNHIITEDLKKSKKNRFNDTNLGGFSDFTDLNHTENFMECEMKKADKSEKKKKNKSQSASETIETSKSISVDESNLNNTEGLKKTKKNKTESTTNDNDGFSMKKKKTKKNNV